MQKYELTARISIFKNNMHKNAKNMQKHEKYVKHEIYHHSY